MRKISYIIWTGVAVFLQACSSDSNEDIPVVGNGVNAVSYTHLTLPTTSRV